MAEDETAAGEGDAQKSEGEPSLRPSMLRKERRDERGDRAEADAGERETQSRRPDGADHAGQSRASSAHWRDGAKRRDDEQGAERDQRRRQCDRRKAVV